MERNFKKAQIFEFCRQGSAESIVVQENWTEVEIMISRFRQKPLLEFCRDKIDRVYHEVVVLADKFARSYPEIVHSFRKAGAE